jgi:CRISPR/Cas system-associated protein Cas10 (large subunit of type III CRISPR-Cas system)
MKLKINEVIENVKDELLCYEEGENLVNRWEKEFKEWIEKNKGKKKDIVVDKGGISLKIKDEEEIFEIADSYMDAVIEGSVKQYWEKF